MGTLTWSWDIPRLQNGVAQSPIRRVRPLRGCSSAWKKHGTFFFFFFSSLASICNPLGYDRPHGTFFELWRKRPCNKSPHPLMYGEGIFPMLYSGFPIEEAVSPHAGNLISASPSGCPHWKILHPLKFSWIIGFPGLYLWRRWETRFRRKMWDGLSRARKSIQVDTEKVSGDPARFSECREW